MALKTISSLGTLKTRTRITRTRWASLEVWEPGHNQESFRHKESRRIWVIISNFDLGTIIVKWGRQEVTNSHWGRTDDYSASNYRDSGREKHNDACRLCALHRNGRRISNWDNNQVDFGVGYLEVIIRTNGESWTVLSRRVGGTADKQDTQKVRSSAQRCL